MPDIISHYLFGLDTTNTIKSSPLYKILKSHRELFFIGLQGPDPLYYYAPYKKQNYTALARQMHTDKTGEFLLAALTYVKKQADNPDVFDPTMAYVSGLICHYVFDYMAHPYVFYLGGRYIPDDPNTEKYLGLHKKIELAIDSLLLEEKFGIPANNFSINKHILKFKTLPPMILDLYEDTLFSVYGISGGAKIWKQAYSHFRAYFSLTKDRVGAKKAVATGLSNVLPKSTATLLSTFSYHQCTEDDFDYLNLKKRVWLHPVTGTVYTFSFKDLIHNALKISSDLLTKSYDFTQSDISYEDFLEIFPHLSYLTALPYQDTRPMTYFSDSYLQLLPFYP